MLGNLRERLFSPIRSVSVTTTEAFQRNRRSSSEQRTTGHRRRSDATESNQSATSSCNMDVGALLLDKHQNDWTRLHDLSEENAKGAQRVDAAVDRLLRSCDQSHEAMTTLILQLASLPALKDAVRQLTARLGSLESGFADVERLLLVLEDTVEVQRLQERQLEERFQLALYKERKMSQLEVFKERLVIERDARRDAVEAHKRSLLRERQETFGVAFEEEMQHYKQHGRVERVLVRGASAEEGVEELRLEDVEIEQDDADALDTFLATEATEEEDNETAASAVLN